ncbi:hypothetical protein GmRootV213_04230 [Variovorax sp. V213]
MIEQRDVTERELGVEECDECHVAPIIGGASFASGAARSAAPDAKAPTSILFTAVLQCPGFGIYSWARLTTLSRRFKRQPQRGCGKKMKVEKIFFEVDAV